MARKMKDPFHSGPGATRGRAPDRRGAPAGRTVVLHDNLVLLRAGDPAQIDAILERAEVRNRLVRRVAADTLLLPRSALPALRTRLAEIGTPLQFGSVDPDAGS